MDSGGRAGVIDEASSRPSGPRTVTTVSVTRRRGRSTTSAASRCPFFNVTAKQSTPPDSIAPATLTLSGTGWAWRGVSFGSFSRTTGNGVMRKVRTSDCAAARAKPKGVRPQPGNPGRGPERGRHLARRRRAGQPSADDAGFVEQQFLRLRQAVRGSGSG